MKCAIYDFETLGQIPDDAACLSFAGLIYDDAVFIEGDGYDYDRLISDCKYFKFSVEDQVTNHGRKIYPETLEWWKGQGVEAKKVLTPSSEDGTIEQFATFIDKEFAPFKDYDKVFTRGNTFDPIFLAELLGKDPFPWWAIRDTRSYLDGLLITDPSMYNKFVPDKYKDKFVVHDPRHDIVMDVMRMQECVRAILL